MYIYLTENKLNGKKYIGQTVGNNKNYYGSGYLIKQALSKYGKSNFKKIILYYCDDREEMNRMEIMCIERYNTISPNGYNISKGGQGNATGNNFKTQTHRDNISKANKGKSKSKEHIENIRKAKTGKKATPEAVEANRLSHLGRVPWNKGLNKDTDERCKKISKTLMGNRNALGCKHTDEANDKMIITRKLNKLKSCCEHEGG